MNIITTVIGRSGSGKSSSIRNLNPETTHIVSTDNKVLPFKGATKFKIDSIKSHEPTEIFSIIDAIPKEKKVIVIDAFTQWSENLMYYANRMKKGWDRQTLYNDTVLHFWNKLADMDGKVIFLIAHPEYGSTNDGEDLISGRVENKQRKGIVEEKSLIVLFAKNRMNKDTGETEYFFETKSDGKTTSKAPFGMFESREIDNDLDLVVRKIKEYYK